MEGGPSRRSRRLEECHAKNSEGNQIYAAGEETDNCGEQKENKSSGSGSSGLNLLSP